jgi:hypothetical protein
MPRPGCVWTHALLIEPTLLEQIQDLSLLQSLVTRPAGPTDINCYCKPVSVEIDVIGKAEPILAMNSAMVRNLVASLYTASSTTIEVSAPGELDAPLFAVWSQQWPRLRRNFRFQTAASRGLRASGSTRFDVTAVLAQMGDGTSQRSEPEAPWVSAAVHDIVLGVDGPLRRFLWRYGEDVRRQRGSFRPLVEVKLLDDKAPVNSVRRAIEIVTSSFADHDDAMRLKQDLVDGALIAGAQLELLKFAFANDKDVVLPPPTDAGASQLAHFWPRRSMELLELAEATLDAEDPFGKSMFMAAAGAIQISGFWSLTRSYPRVRERMVQARPELLVAEGIAELDDDALTELLSLVPSDAAIIADLIQRLLVRSNNKLTHVAFARFPSVAAQQVVLAVDGGKSRLSRAWLRELIDRPKLLLQPSVMALVSRTSLLYELADGLGWLTPEVATAGTEPWISALVDISSDLADDQRDTLSSFLVALAMASGGDGGCRLLEGFFDAVHRQALNSRLPWRARNILLPLLPDLSWGQGWDFGLKLRLAVAAAYVRNAWPPESYAALTGGPKARALLADAALKLPGGHRYAKAASA